MHKSFYFEVECHNLTQRSSLLLFFTSHFFVLLNPSDLFYLVSRSFRPDIRFCFLFFIDIERIPECFELFKGKNDQLSLFCCCCCLLNLASGFS